MNRKNQIALEIRELQEELTRLNAIPEDTFSEGTVLIISKSDNFPKYILLKEENSTWLVYRQVDTVSDYTKHMTDAAVVTKYTQDETITP